jgi:hypothetical protein
MLRPLFLTGSEDDGEILYTVTVDAPNGQPLMGLIASDIDVRMIAWPDGEQAFQIGRLAYPDGASTPPSTVRTVLDLSTAHLSDNVRQNLNSYEGVTAHEFGYGWLLFVPTPDTIRGADVEPDEVEDLDEYEYPPAEVVAIWQLAEKLNCDYVLFDRDGPTDGNLPTYP